MTTWASTARNQLRFTLLAPWNLTALLVGAQILFGFPHWIVSAALATWVFIETRMADMDDHRSENWVADAQQRLDFVANASG